MSDSEIFVGRQGLIRRIFSRFGADRPQSIAIIGGPESGKSSLIKYLSNPEIQKQFLDNPEHYCFITCFANDLGTDSPDFFLSFLENQLTGKSKSEFISYENLGELVFARHSEGYKIIIMVDDFHKITSNHSYPLEFFSFLRSISNNYNLAYLTTSSLELQKLCAVQEIAESPFFNIFTYMHLGMIGFESAVELFQHYSGAELELAKSVVMWCGDSPTLLKRAADKLATSDNSIPISDKYLTSILYQEFLDHFRKIISTLPPESNKAIQKIRKGKAPAASDAYYLTPMLKQGFLYETDNKIIPFSPAFQLFLKSDYSPKMLGGET